MVFLFFFVENRAQQLNEFCFILYHGIFSEQLTTGLNLLQFDVFLDPIIKVRNFCVGIGATTAALFNPICYAHLQIDRQICKNYYQIFVILEL